jgi:hypothetical protein
VRNLENLETIKSMYIKKALQISLFMPSRVVCDLIRMQLLSPSATAVEKMLLQRRIKKNEI